MEEREKIGYQCKRLINLGRVAWLQGHGFDAETIQYVDSGFSLENVALLATRKTGKIMNQNIHTCQGLSVGRTVNYM